MEKADRLNFRLLRADEIDCRVSTITEKGLFLLLYKDARVDQNILDETVGPMNWQRHHSRENANCTVAIWDVEKAQWIEKEDTGTESNTEKEKGLASDSFKRACFNWGIGRELYTAPRIWISAEYCNIEKKKDKLACYDPFQVKEIQYDDNRNIKSLIIVGKYNRVVYPRKAAEQDEDSVDPGSQKEPSAGFESDPNIALVQTVHINTLAVEMARTGVGIKNLLASYGLDDIHKMNIAQFTDAMQKFKKKPDKPAPPDPVIPKEEAEGLPWHEPER